MDLQQQETGYHKRERQVPVRIQTFSFSVWFEPANNDLKKRAA
jgi:hypothetical protein